MSNLTNLAVFREVFKECSIFAKKIYTILNEHEEQLLKNKRKASSSGMSGSMSGPDSPNKRKKRKKGSKVGPKKPLSSYMLYVQKNRPDIVLRHPDAKFTDIGKMLGSQWAKMSEEEKKMYHDMASEEKNRYSQELAAYGAPGHHGVDEDGQDHNHDITDSVAPAQLLQASLQSQSGMDHDMHKDGDESGDTDSEEDDGDQDDDVRPPSGKKTGDSQGKGSR